MSKKKWVLIAGGLVTGTYFLFRDRPETIERKETIQKEENGLPEQIHESTFFLVTKDCLPLSLKIVEPNYRPIKAVVQVIHGVLEHSGRYLELAHYLAKQGYAVILSDLRGHGHSIDKANPLGQMPGYQRMIADQVEITDFIKTKYPKQPIYLYGHSFGSILARLYLQTNDEKIDKLVLTGTPQFLSISKFGLVIADVAMKVTGKDKFSWIMKKLSGFGSEDKTWLTSDIEQLEKAENDPFIIPGYNNIGVATIWEADHELKNYAKFTCQNPELPILSITGQEDYRITGGDKGLLDTEKTLRKIGYKTVDMYNLPGMKHEVIQEIEREVVYRMITDFFET
ncbi:MAG TPA: lysophospholipase [Candidatus Tetragenococcus pullicola]|nr:lysophospholipase [Candidatus Tetragenococcus pullicola]